MKFVHLGPHSQKNIKKKEDKRHGAEGKKEEEDRKSKQFSRPFKKLYSTKSEPPELD